MGQGILINFLVMTLASLFFFQTHSSTFKRYGIKGFSQYLQLQYGTYSTQYKLLNGESSVQNKEVSYVLFKSGRMGEGAAAIRALVKFALPFSSVVTEPGTSPRRMINRVLVLQIQDQVFFYPCIRFPAKD